MHPIGACFMQAANNSYNMSNGRSGTRSISFQQSLECRQHSLVHILNAG